MTPRPSRLCYPWSSWILMAFGLLILPLALTGCSEVGREAPRRGDEIVVCGRQFHTGAPVVLWTDPGGYDAYRVEKRFAPWPKAQWPADAGPSAAGETPNRYGIRFAARIRQDDCPLAPDDFERIRGGGWDLPTLQRVVDQFVLHYDAAGTSRQCFRILHDVRNLSVHFMLDIDGTIYQTLDLKERAWHATTSNDRSIGIEIANIGAYGPGEDRTFERWYERECGCPLSCEACRDEPVRIRLPASIGDGGVRRPAFVGRPARPQAVEGIVQGRTLRQFDLTPEQYESLARLTATLCTVFPNLPCDYPRDDEGSLVMAKLPDDRLATYRGILGHWHIQENKVDPGPALDWDRVVRWARRLMPSAHRSAPAPRATLD